MATTQQQNLHQLIERNLTNHPPSDERVVEAFEKVREATKAASHLMVDLCPPGVELTAALDYIELGNAKAVAAIARNQDLTIELVDERGRLQP